MKERGQALLLMLTLLVFVGAAALFTFLSPTSGRLREEEKTAYLMILARDALIGHAAASSVRPGQLPCPDLITNTPASIPPNIPNDGIADARDAAGNCPSNIGRLPWKTLGLEDLRDGAGERFWYAASTIFTRDPTAPPSCYLNTPPCSLNSDTLGDITIYQDGTPALTVITNRAVAVIVAPGQALGAQVRSAANANNPANYLDTISGINNAIPGANPPLAPLPSLIRAQAGSTFNDRLVVIDTSQVIPVIERLVAREVQSLMENYRIRTDCPVANGGCANVDGGTTPGVSATGCYPWADTSNGQSDAPPIDPSVARNRGRVPVEQALPYQWGTQVCITLPATPPLPTVPQWFKDNKWREVVYYSVAKQLLPLDPCMPATNCYASYEEWLRIPGVLPFTSHRLIVLTPGILVTAPLAVPANPTPRSPVPLNDNTFWQYYFPPAPPSAASENADLDDRYEIPPVTYSGNRVYTCPLPPNPC